MVKFKISELHPAGSKLFHDSESFLNELSEQETLQVFGSRHRKTIFTHLSRVFTVRPSRHNDIIHSIFNQTVNARSVGNVNTVLIR
ncbi:MAG: hypothetical protein ACREPR_24460 [Brasilonema sp.]